MSKSVATYDCKKVIVTLGTHMVTGAENDSFVTIAKQGDGVTSNVGCFGDIERSLDPNRQYKITLSLQQTSTTNKWLQNMFDYDQETGDGVFPVLIKDLRGKVMFSADQAWVVKPADYGYGKATSSRSWELDTGDGEMTDTAG